MIPALIKKTVEAKVFAALQQEFADSQSSDPGVVQSWQKQAKVASVIAEALVEVLQTQAEIAPGIPVATSGGPGATTGPGKIL
jgi:hypothetical protein